MKKHFIIGNPVEHSLSPKIHNYWFKKYNIIANYEKFKLEENQIKDIIDNIKSEKVFALNVTVPFKQKVIPFIDILTPIAKQTGSVNTIYKKNGKVLGDNTDVAGFELSIKNSNFSIKNKSAFILGAGGVVPSIITALQNLKIKKIYLSNRTIQKAQQLKKIFEDIEIINWGQIINFDIIINATSIGLKKMDKFNFDLSAIGKNKFFYDVIYNPPETNFLIEAKKFKHSTQNGKMMFIYQAQKSFEIWHDIKPQIDDNLIKYLYG